MSLGKYREKRRFDVTPEPAGRAEAASGQSPQFVVQKHDARRLHFDFRLEVDGVLKSWAVPRGPSLHPGRRRLAVMTEDHPLDYASFEGMIPEGQYGGGPVIVWDRGTWECEGSAAAALARGKLKLRLHGERLRGGWTLVRTGKASAESNQWLLLKERDGDAIGASDADPVETQQTSVLSGRTLQQVRTASSKASSTRGDGPRKKTSQHKTPPRKRPPADKKKALTLADLPAPVAPKLPRLVDHPPRGDAWVHELKLDGYRMQVRIAAGGVQLLTRNHHDWTERLPALADAAAGLPVETAVFDGELVAVDSQGATDFSALQSAFGENRTDRLILYVFDVLYLNGHALVDRSLLDRKALLEPIVRGAAIPRIQYLDHLEGDGQQLLDQCRIRGLEGIVSKRRDRGYMPGRADDWLKCKCRYRELFVVGGYTRSGATAGNIGALLVGHYNTHGELIYSGRVGTGLSGRTAEALRRRFDNRRRPEAPFAVKPTGDMKDVVWVEPSVVVEVAFNSWTRENLLRHASLENVAEGVPPRSVLRDSLTLDLPPGDPKTAEKSSATIVESPQPTPVDDSLRELMANVRLTNPQRVLYPRAGYTKLDLVRYFTQVSAWLLPHIERRPISLVRCPQGIEGECFFQKHVKEGTPSEFKSARVKEDEDAYLIIDDLPGLLAAVQMNCLELHPWGGRRDRLDRPDRLIFDLDPDAAVPWQTVVTAAWLLRERLEEIGLLSFVKTTGGKGLHVTVPLVRRHSWDRVMEFAAEFVKSIAGEFPKRYTANMSKQARVNRIFIDYHRNHRGATAIAPYSPRAREGATVATPLRWEELTPEVTPDTWTITTVPERLRNLEEDPWAEIRAVKQTLKK